MKIKYFVVIPKDCGAKGFYKKGVENLYIISVNQGFEDSVKIYKTNEDDSESIVENVKVELNKLEELKEQK